MMQSNVAHQHYIMIRIRREDHARLVAYRDRVTAWARENPERAAPWLLMDDVGLGVAIRELLRRADAHLARSRAQGQRRLKKPR